MPTVKPTLVALALVLASPLVSGCGEPGVCDGLYLKQVQTANEEADEMYNFRAECRPLSLRAFWPRPARFREMCHGWRRPRLPLP